MSEPRPGYLLSPRAGLVLTPLILGLVGASVGSGQLIARTGRYRWAIVSGPLVMAAGFALLAGLDAESTRGAATIAMIVLGLGLGLVMQNLLLVVQNTVPSRELGVATSATQFFRTTGGTIGVSVLLIPEKPLRRSVRESEPAPTPA